MTEPVKKQKIRDFITYEFGIIPDGINETEDEVEVHIKQHMLDKNNTDPEVIATKVSEYIDKAVVVTIIN